MAARGGLRQLRMRPGARAALEIHLTQDIVSHPPPGARVLVNSANESLCGTELPYFPMLETPPGDLMGSRWGGLSAGSGMFYSSQVVDGKVHLHAGRQLKEHCKDLSCSVGHALATPPFGLASVGFERIIH